MGAKSPNASEEPDLTKAFLQKAAGSTRNSPAISLPNMDEHEGETSQAPKLFCFFAWGAIGDPLKLEKISSPISTF